MMDRRSFLVASAAVLAAASAHGAPGGSGASNLAQQVKMMPEFSSIPDDDHRAAVVAPGLAAMVDTSNRIPEAGALMYVLDYGASPRLVCASECSRPGRKILGRAVGRYRVPETAPFDLLRRA